MTRQRNSYYVWVSWLAKLMAGDMQCQWASWFRSHYTAYAKAQPDPRQATWLVAHNKCLDELCKSCTEQSLSYFKESQNSFKVTRRSMTIGAKPDLIVLEKDKSYTVYDIKTGQPKASDIVQVMLYLSFLPYSTAGFYKGKTINGCVFYQGGERNPVSQKSFEGSFRDQITRFLDILDSPMAPGKTPSYSECRFCDITKYDCPDKIETETTAVQDTDLPI